MERKQGKAKAFFEKFESGKCEEGYEFNPNGECVYLKMIPPDVSRWDLIELIK